MSSAAGQPSAKAKPPRRHHLYLVFDDWCRGYSIRKVSLSPSPRPHQQSAVSGQEDEARSEASVRPVWQRLPPHSVRMVAPRSAPKYIVSAFGSRILAINPPGDSVDLGDGSSESYFPMFGVRSRGITFGPWKERKHPWMADAPIYLPVGKKLFTLSTASFEMLCLDYTIYPPASYCSRDRSLRWSWEQLRRQPFKVDDVASYSLHPDKRTFLVSTKADAAAAATFAFDTKTLSWKLLGNWALPFAGRGHFVPHLRAFVGLSRDPDTLGQLYSCDVPSYDHAGDGQCPAPASRVCNEKLFSGDPGERHVSATLVDLRCAPIWSLFLSCHHILSYVWNEWRPDDLQEPTGAILPSA